MLVVDDDDDLRRCIARALSPVADVECARDEGEALTILESGEFDAVLTDYELDPGLGTELLEEVSLRCPHVKRFLMSGRDEPVTDPSLRPWDDFFRKPFGPDAVVMALKKKLRRD